MAAAALAAVRGVRSELGHPLDSCPLRHGAAEPRPGDMTGMEPFHQVFRFVLFTVKV